MARTSARTGSRPAPRSPKPRSPWRRRLILTAEILGGGLLLAFIALVVAVYVARSQLPSFEQLKSSPNGQMIRVHASDGSVIFSRGPSYGQWLSYQQIPAVMRDATVSVEDRRFRSHWGVDPIGVARSVQVRLQRGRWVQGGSTITQQLARNIFLSSQKKFGRKFREWILALALERKFTKDQVLELYLNKVYYGGGAYGIDAASRLFFGHGADQLSLEEAAVIAGLVKAPSNYSPTADAEAALGRAGVVIDAMVRSGAITPQQAAVANPRGLTLQPPPRQNSVRYFTDWTLPQLDTLIDEQDKPLDVYTTLDPKMQNAADNAIRANTPAGAQGALVSIDRDGAVRALVGGRDYVSSIYNRATQAVRQPGSSFKLFVYLAALESGHRPEDQVVDEPVTIDGWSPRNDSRHNSGAMTLRTAFAYSINTVAAKLGQEVGFTTVADMARRFGITTPVNTHPSMVLGTSDVRLIDMTRAFASVGQQGVAVAPYGITRVESEGEVIYTHQADRSHVLVSPTVAVQMIDLLQTAVNTGTGRAAQIGRPVAGKTGTTTSGKDGWFLGFSSGLTTGIWMGRDDARPIPGLHGGTAPARAFAAFMGPATRGRPIEAFPTPIVMPDVGMGNEEDAYFGEPDNSIGVDPDGNPVPDRPVRATPPVTDEDTGDEASVSRGESSARPEGGDQTRRATRPDRRPTDQDQLDDLIDQVTRGSRAPPPPRGDSDSVGRGRRD